MPEIPAPTTSTSKCSGFIRVCGRSLYTKTVAAGALHGRRACGASRCARWLAAWRPSTRSASRARASSTDRRATSCCARSSTSAGASRRWRRCAAGCRAAARQRGWRRLRLLSSAKNDYNRDYHGEEPDGAQNPMLNVFVRRYGETRHFWASEALFGPSEPGQNQRHLDMMRSLWNLLDVTPWGRGEWYPGL